MMQIDMNGYNPTANQNRIGIITDFTNADLNEIMRKALLIYAQLPHGNTLCGYACSDHASFHRNGYRASFAFEVYQFNMLNRNIHTANDLINVLDMKRVAQYVKFAVGVVIELSKK